MKKIAHCLPLFLIIAFGIVSAQSYQVAIPKDKSTIVDTKGKSPSTSAIRITPRVREDYQSTFSRSTADQNRSTCGTMPFFEERHEPQRSCSLYGSADEVADKVMEFREEVGDFGTLLYAGHDWADVDLAKKSMELMAEKVMPKINDNIKICLLYTSDAADE